MDTNVTAEVEAPKGVSALKRAVHSLVMSGLDLEFFVALAVSRYLSNAQVKRLGFWSSESTQNHRLATFAGLSARSAPGGAYIEKLETHDSRGAKTVIWGLTERGYGIAADHVAVPPQQVVGPELLAHEIQLNDVLVALFLAGAPPRPVDGRTPRVALGLPLHGKLFKWTASGGSRIPFRQFDREQGKAKDRLIKPDAVLEIPGRRQRIFIEQERGTHTIVPVDAAAKDGATVNKVARYQRVCGSGPDPTKRVTYYQQQYPDGFAPHLLFVVGSEVRRDNVRAAIRAMPKAVGATLPVEVYTRTEAAHLLVDQVYGDGTADRVFPKEANPQPAGTGWNMNDVHELAQFAFAAYATIQGERHRVRAENRKAGTKTPEPQYPPRTAETIDLMRKLGIWRDREDQH